jgi:hypothetical protein
VVQQYPKTGRPKITGDNEVGLAKNTRLQSKMSDSEPSASDSTVIEETPAEVVRETLMNKVLKMRNE